MRGFLTFLALSLVLLVGCSEDEGSQLAPEFLDLNTDIVFFGSCDHRTHIDTKKRQCREWYGSFFETINVEFSCVDMFNGVYTQDFCQIEKALGVCLVEIDGDSEVRFFYYADDWELQSAESHCKSKYIKSTWFDIGGYDRGGPLNRE